MEKSEYKNIFENEDHHFFYVFNQRIVLSLMKKYINLYSMNDKLKILDAGCGTGLLAKKLTKLGDVMAIDISHDAIKFAKKRGIKVQKSSINKTPFNKDTFDIITSIDVIYHKKVNDDKALNEFFRILKPGGFVIIRVSANKWLKTAHDKQVHTKQRYNRKELKNKLKKAGFTIELLSYINILLLPFVIFLHIKQKITRKKDKKSEIYKLPNFINNLVLTIISLESYLIPRISLPFGLGLIVVCRKPIY